jgi:hypothetical protein
VTSIYYDLRPARHTQSHLGHDRFRVPFLHGVRNRTNGTFPITILSALTIAARSHDSKEIYATVIRHALHRQFDTPQGFLVLGLKPSSPASPPHYRKGMWNAIHARLRAGSAGADGTPHL